MNEERNIYELHRRLESVVSKLNISTEYIWIDDGSRDETLTVIRKLSTESPNNKYISFTRNFGHQIALYAGIEHAKGDNIVLIDGDLQDPPERIEDLWNCMQQGYDVVYAKRNKRHGESFLKKTTAALFYRLLNRITKFDIPVDTGDFRIFNRRVADALLNMKDKSKFLRGQIAWLGFKECSIQYDRDRRNKGKSQFSYRTMFRFAFDGITGFSNFPLRFASISGMIVSLISFLMIIYVLLAKLVWNQTISGWASIMVTILFLGGIQLLSLGIIGEYISRINDAVRNRPLYIVTESKLD
jgi:dolichol-phosphate mannosyltransferase